MGHKGVGFVRRTKPLRVRLVAYSPSTVKKFICGNGWASKEDVSRAVVSKYPELKVYLTPKE